MFIFVVIFKIIIENFIMKQITKIIILILIISTDVCLAQNQKSIFNNYRIKSSIEGIGFNDSIKLCNIPALEVPQLYKSQNSINTLAVSVDNSLKQFFRPITWQSGYECGQMGGVAFVYTYEIDRLRNVPANIAANQYPSHFVWNFLNDAYNYNGVSFFDTWEIVRTCGTPNVVDYGGALNTGGEKRWMSGYTQYYNGMKNKISGVYGMNVATADGLQILKNYLNDHLEGSPDGGIGCYYATYASPSATLPVGTPNAGKYIMTTAGGSGHTWVVCGYDDSIRYDYNGDGQYTNNIDINGDGIVDMRDWEIGGLKIANVYAGNSWANSGFSYIMYKVLAEPNVSGGIWNNTIYTVKAKPSTNPQLTMKVTIKHTCRNKIKVLAGISTNTSATKPDKRMEFPIINFHGGNYYMQGDSTEANKTIEVGLDISPLLSELTSGQTAKFFLEIADNDPTQIGQGQVIGFSVLDYTSGVIETFSPQTYVTIIYNDTTRLSLLKPVTFNKVAITTDSLITKINKPYSHQLLATMGDTPYKWDVKMDYNETVTNATFPNITAQVLNTGSSGYAIQNLPFQFPFYGKNYSQIYVYADGYIKFDNAVYTFPFLIDANLLFRSNKMIAPFLADLTFSSGQGVWYEGDANSATIRWKGSVVNQSSSLVNVAMKIYATGQVEFYYGNISVAGGFTSAISAGNVIDYYFTSLSSAFTNNTVEKKVVLVSPDYPLGMNLTESGLFTATPNRYYNTNIKFRVTDNNGVYSVKSFPFITKGLLAEYTIASGDTVVKSNDTILLNIKIKNISTLAYNNINVKLTTTDTVITFVDNTELISSINAGDSVIIMNAFKFITKNNIQDAHNISILSNIITPTDTFAQTINYRVNAFNIKTGTVTIVDGNNNILEPNETAALILEVKNIGGSMITNLHLDLSTSDPNIILNPNFANIDTINSHSSKNAFFVITTSPIISPDHLIVLNAHLTGSNNFSYNTFFFIKMGGDIENFETHDFSKYPWQTMGTLPWYVSDSLPHQGLYAARSGAITHSQNSSLSITQTILADGNIKFYKKVSCEKDATNHAYDYLAFYIDGTEKARWDGEIDWSQESFPVTVGTHIFKWSYVKDYSVSNGADCAWIDDVQFPINGDAAPNLLFTPSVINKTIDLAYKDSSILMMNNQGTGMLIYTSSFTFPGTTITPWAYSKNIAGSINKNTSESFVINFKDSVLSVGNYNCQLNITANFNTNYTIPVNLTVINTTGIENYQTADAFDMSCSPNPFSNQTTISINLKEDSKVKLMIYDVSGREIKVLENDAKLQKGKHSYKWDGQTADANVKVAGNIYFCKLITDKQTLTQKLFLIR